MARHELPALPYAFNALEPHIDARTMEIHHGKHHAAYVNNVNAALERHLAALRAVGRRAVRDLSRIPEDIRIAVRNNGGGHANHAFFWPVLSASGGGSPVGELAAAISAEFGSFDAFKEKFTAAAYDSLRAGWAWLSLDGRASWWSPRRRTRIPLVSDGQGADARPRCLGTCLLPELPEPAAGLHRGLLEHRRLEARQRQLRSRTRLIPQGSGRTTTRPRGNPRAFFRRDRWQAGSRRSRRGPRDLNAGAGTRRSQRTRRVVRKPSPRLCLRPQRALRFTSGR